MKYKTLINKTGLSEADKAEIEAAVKKAENGTSGEIAIAITAESDSYAFWELLVAVFTGFAALVALFPLSGKIFSWLGRKLWLVQPIHLLIFYAVIFAIIVLLFYFLYNIPFFDSLVVPDSVKKKAVTQRAMRYFAESGVYCTKEHTGILIFVSYFEREVRIIADKGLKEKVSEDLWKTIAQELALSIAKGSVKEGFILSIEKCGKVFKENCSTFTETPADENELPDSLVILRDER